MNNNILSFEQNKIDNCILKKFYIERLSLKNFRNHSDLNLSINNSSVLIYGENGCGKTNILEAISLFNYSKGFRKSKIEDFLFQSKRFDGNNQNWGINLQFISPHGKTSIGTGLKEISNKKSRIVRIDSENSNLSSLQKILKISYITPQMSIIFQTGMGERRRFIDRLASSIDSLHLNRVYKNDKLLRERNNILLQFNSDKTWLSTIESQIAELSVAIIARRMDLVQALNDLYHEELKNNLLTDFFPPVVINLIGETEKLLLKKPASEVEDHIKFVLKNTRFGENSHFTGHNNTEIEIVNRKNNKNIDFSSTGEQKLVLISIILSHARLLNFKFNMAPILLLDDIVEHLDKNHRKALFIEISRHFAQSWFTSTSKEPFKDFPELITKINLPKIRDFSNSNYDFRYGDT